MVYEKSTGGFLFTANWSFEPGLYRVAASGKGKPAKLTILGSGVQSGVDGRYYLTQVENSGLG